MRCSRRHSESELLALVARGAGARRVDARIEQVTSFAFAAQIAYSYRGIVAFSSATRSTV